MKILTSVSLHLPRANFVQHLSRIFSPILYPKDFFQAFNSKICSPKMAVLSTSSIICRIRFSAASFSVIVPIILTVHVFGSLLLFRVILAPLVSSMPLMIAPFLPMMAP